MKKIKKIKNIITTFTIVIALVCVIGGFICFPYLTCSKDIVTINKTEVKRNKTSDKYLIFATNSEGEKIVLENTDSIAFFKFNSSDIQGDIEIGETYKIKTSGIRMPFLSMYKNIIDIEKES